VDAAGVQLPGVGTARDAAERQEPVSLNPKRLDHLETSLTPLEAVLLWLAEAHAHPSLTAYMLTLKGQPLAAYPLVWLPDLVEPGVRAAHKGEPRSDVDHAVFEAKRDLAFLFHLVMQGNAVWFEKERALSLGYLLVVEKLARLTEWAPRKLTVHQGKDREDYLQMAARFADLINSLHGELLVLDAALAAVGCRRGDPGTGEAAAVPGAHGGRAVEGERRCGGHDDRVRGGPG